MITGNYFRITPAWGEKTETHPDNVTYHRIIGKNVPNKRGLHNIHGITAQMDACKFVATRPLLQLTAVGGSVQVGDAGSEEKLRSPRSALFQIDYSVELHAPGFRSPTGTNGICGGQRPSERAKPRIPNITRRGEGSLSMNWRSLIVKN